MKKNLLLFIITACICSTMHAQVYKTKVVESGESLSDKSYYLFPLFTNGTVKFKNGGTLVSKMNFNVLIGEMQFIDANNDTLVIAKPEDIDSIVLNNSLFFFNDGYYQILASSASAKLVVLRKAKYEALKIGALGLPNKSGAGTETYTSMETYLGERKLVMNEDVEVTDETAYFLISKNSEMIKADKAGFIKLFPTKENSIQTYLKQTKTKFNKEADLKNLFDHCVAE